MPFSIDTTASKDGLFFVHTIIIFRNVQVSAKQILLTDEALYGVSFVFDELTQRTRTVWEFRVPLTEISSVTLSPYRDNTIAIFARVSATPKIVVCRRKVELAGLLKKHSSPNFQLNVQDVLPVQLQQNNGKMQQVDVRFIKDETISHDATLSFPKNGDVEVSTRFGYHHYISVYLSLLIIIIIIIILA